MTSLTYLHEHTPIAKAQKKMYQRRIEAVSNVRGPGDEKHYDDTKMIELYRDVRKIRTRNTGTLYLMDEEDWNLAKGIPWYEGVTGDLHTFNGQSFESYVGIVGARLYPFAPRDKRRQHYHGA